MVDNFWFQKDILRGDFRSNQFENKIVTRIHAEDDPVLELLKFVDIATNQVREVLKLGNVELEQKKEKKIDEYRHKTNLNDNKPYPSDQDRNAFKPYQSRISYGNIASRFDTMQRWDSGATSQTVSCHCHGYNGLPEVDNVNMSIQEQWSNYVDSFLWQLESGMDAMIPTEMSHNVEGTDFDTCYLYESHTLNREANYMANNMYSVYENDMNLQYGLLYN